MLLNYQILTFQNWGSKISFHQTIRSRAQISGCRNMRIVLYGVNRQSHKFPEIREVIVKVTKERWLLFVGGFNSDKEMYLDELSQTVPFLLKWVFTISKIKDQKYLHHSQSLCSDFSLSQLWALRVTFIVGVCWSRCSTHLKSNDTIFRRQLTLNFQTAHPWLCVHSIHISIVESSLWNPQSHAERMLLGRLASL